MAAAVVVKGEVGKRGARPPDRRGCELGGRMGVPVPALEVVGQLTQQLDTGRCGRLRLVTVRTSTENSPALAAVREHNSERTRRWFLLS